MIMMSSLFRALAVPRLATWRALRGTGIPYFVYPHGMLDPKVQAGLSVQASEEMVLLALGGLSGVARRSRCVVYNRAGAVAGKAVILAL